MPSQSQFQTTDLMLANLCLRVGQQRFIAEEVVPVLPVTVKTGKVYAIDTAQEMRIPKDTRRAPGTKPQRVDIELSRPITFTCDDHALSGLVPDELKAIQSPATLAGLNKTQELAARLMLDREVQLKSSIDSTFTSTLTTAVASGSRWDDGDNGDPIGDIKAKISLIELTNGVTPNRLAMDSGVLRAITEHPDFVDRRKHTGLPDDTGNAAALASILGLEKVVVAQSQKNSAIKGQTASLARVWADDVFLYYYEAPNAEFRGVGLYTSWRSGDMAAEGEGGIAGMWRVERWRESEAKSDGIIVNAYYGLNWGADSANSYTAPGHLFTGVLDEF